MTTHNQQHGFKSSDGYWSGATSHWFVKLNHNTDHNACNSFEYWYENDFAERHMLSLGTNSDIQTVLNLPMDEVENGFHQLNFRVGYTNGYYSPVSTSYFFKYGSGMALGNYIFEYWLDDDIQNAVQQQFASTEGVPSVFNINVNDAGFQENSLHRLSYCVKGIGSGVPQQSAVSTQYFFYHAQNANRLRYWYDNNTAAAQTVTLSSGENVTFIGEISTAGLTNGVHTLNFCLQSDNGINGSTYTEYFEKGQNPFAPAFADEQYISDYVYWFDDNEATKIADNIPSPHRQHYTYNKNLALPDDVTRGKHTVNYRFRDNFGQWTETVRDTFKMLQGDITKAKIKNLDPNVNLLRPFTVREFATAYLYYKVVDDLDMPINKAVINYKVGNNSLNSQPTDKDGIAVLEIPVWGTDIDNIADDYVPVNSGFQTINFVCLKDSLNNVLQVGLNNFTQTSINVIPFFPDDMHYGISLGGSESLGSKLFNNKINAGYTLTLGRLFNEYYEQTGWDVSTELKAQYSAQNTTQTSFSEFPFVSLDGSFTLGGGFKFKKSIKETLPYNTSTSYLKILYNMLTGVWNTSGFEDEDIHLLLNAISTKLGLGNESAAYQESTKEGFIKIEAGAEGKINLDALSYKLGLSANSTAGVSFSNALKYDGANSSETLINKYKLNADIGIDLTPFNFSFKEGSQSANFGLTVSGSLSSSLGITTEKPRYLTAFNKGSVSVGTGWQLEISPSWGTSHTNGDNSTFSQIRSISGKLSKDYKSTLSFKKPVFDVANHLQINDPLWGYFTNSTSNTGIVFGTAFGNHLEHISDGFADLAPEYRKNLDDAVKWTEDKEYSLAGNYSYSETVNFFGWKFNIGWNGGIFSKSTFPISESYYHFGVNKTLKLVKYEDLNRFRDISSPTQPFVEQFTHASFLLDEWLKDNFEWYESYKNTTESILGSLIYKWWEWTGQLAPQQSKRKYSKYLKGIKALNENPQTDISNMIIEIPCASQEVFPEGTEVHFSHYYPGGEVLGATVAKDTFIVISDISFLSAYCKWDTLSVAPNGNFKVFSTVGADDLAFLEISPSYPVGVYHKAFSDSLWQFIGNTNDTIYTNKLGKFCLGVGVSDDKIPPVISIAKDSLAGEVNISITDNMAVYWKNTIVLINGVSYEYERNGGNITVPLTEEQLATDIYVTVHASDLARNETQENAVFAAPTGISEVATNTHIMLFPNPASDIVNLQIGNKVLLDGTKYAIVNTLGQIFARGAVSEEITKINVSYLQQGVYFVVVFDEKLLITSSKFVKK
ncbi:MAG: T9SS type A sorting domain-containing protein [Dysgonamonadaceae bacterium]|jgi:hypothetical protein|nr:T9SS type A sorting domain-containing protein [Dysgonamonadaceae bacterium]